MIWILGKIVIQHGDTGVVYEIDGDDFEFEIDEKNQREEGIEIIYLAEFNHPELGDFTWKVCEYPVGIFNHNGWNSGKHKLLGDIDFRKEGGILDEDDEEYNQDRIDELVEWFKENYDTPENRLPHESKEGGYQWIYGGPCDARQELEDKFSKVPEEIIEAAVEEIESDGTVDWTPIPDSNYSDTEDMFPDYNLKKIDNELNTLINNAPKPKTAPAFALGDDNRFHIAEPPDNQPANIRDVSLKRLRETIDALLESRIWANTHPELTPIVEEYKKTISGEQVSISEVYWSGIKFDNAVRILEQTLPFNAKLNITTALNEHGVYIMLDEEGRRLVEASRAYRQSAEQTEVLKTAGEQFAKNITDNPDLFGEDVQDHFSDFSNDIGKGHHPERSNQSALNRTSNVVLGVLAGFGIDAITTIIQNGVVASIPGKMASTAVAGLSDKVWIFLTNIVPSLKVIANSFIIESPWLIEVVQFLERIISVIG